jgi:hypothetical protein
VTPRRLRVLGGALLGLCACGGDVVILGGASAPPDAGPSDATVAAPEAGGESSVAFDSAVIPDVAAGQTDAVSEAAADAPVEVSSAVTLATGQNNPLNVAVDDVNVYWTNHGFSANGFRDGAVVKVAVGGGNPVTLATGPAEAIAVNASTVYFTGAGSIMAVPIDGGTVTTLVTGQSFVPPDIALDGDEVYWSNRGSQGGPGAVMKAPLAGGAPVTIAATSGPPANIAVDAYRVYWLELFPGSPFPNVPLASPSVLLMTLPIDGGTPLALTGKSGLDFVAPAESNLIVRGDSVYAEFFSGGLVRVPLDAGASPSTLAQGSNTGIAVDDTSVYWAWDESGLDGGAGVAKVCIDGGPPAAVAVGLSAPGAVAVDRTSVYWIAGNQGPFFGSIMKAPK